MLNAFTKTPRLTPWILLETQIWLQIFKEPTTIEIEKDYVNRRSR